MDALVAKVYIWVQNQFCYFDSCLYEAFKTLKFNFSFASGYFGDGVPVISGWTSLIKTHGYFNSPKTNKRDPQYPEDTIKQMRLVRKTGIVLIRNPFKVLNSFRNYDQMKVRGLMQKVRGLMQRVK